MEDTTEAQLTEIREPTPDEIAQAEAEWQIFEAFVRASLYWGTPIPLDAGLWDHQWGLA